MKARIDNNSEKSLYDQQNRAIHKARSQLCMDLDDCRELAKEISGKASISSLTIRQRWELIEALKAKGARIFNPKLTGNPEPQNKHGRAKDIYPSRLEYWNEKFPRRRSGYASNKEISWIETLFILDFNDGRAGDSSRGLRRFLYRQTRSLKDGPISDLAFLKSHQVRAIITPLRAKAKGGIVGSGALFD